jgi:molybdopterin-guanine dinucleotide biosynthesis protein A
MSALPPVLGGVLIGGASTRMGSPKHLLRIRDTTLVEHVSRALRPSVERVFVIGVGDLPPGFDAACRIADAAGVSGPLGGLLGAMHAHPAAAWIFASCDLPLISPAAVAWLLAQRAPRMLAVLPRSTPARVEPLLALYEPTARAELENFARAPRTGPRALALHPDVATPAIPAHLRDCWRNINTAAEWARLHS